MNEAAEFLGDSRRVSIEEFWSAAEAVLRLSPLRIPDRRRNVVHVLSVYEARQWELPIVFICGLAEQQFPKRHAQEPLFPDSARQRLRYTFDQSVRMAFACRFIWSTDRSTWPACSK